MIKTIPFIIIATMAAIGGCSTSCSHGANLPLSEKFINAEIQVESSGRDNAIGDNGKALGALQIHKKCWQDAVEFDHSISGSYTNCFNRSYSIKIMTSYLNRYCARAIRENNFEVMARNWNGGSFGPNNPRTLNYWLKVKKEMKIK